MNNSYLYSTTVNIGPRFGLLNQALWDIGNNISSLRSNNVIGITVETKKQSLALTSRLLESCLQAETSVAVISDISPKDLCTSIYANALYAFQTREDVKKYINAAKEIDGVLKPDMKYNAVDASRVTFIGEDLIADRDVKTQVYIVNLDGINASDIKLLRMLASDDNALVIHVSNESNISVKRALLSAMFDVHVNIKSIDDTTNYYFDIDKYRYVNNKHITCHCVYDGELGLFLQS